MLRYVVEPCCLLVVEETHDSSLPGAVSASTVAVITVAITVATVAPITMTTAAFAAISLTPASVDPATLTNAAIDDVACGLAFAPFTSNTVASRMTFAEDAPPPREVGPPPTTECMVCNNVTMPQPMWNCNTCTRTMCAECVQEHACGCGDACGCYGKTIVRHPLEMLFVELYNLGLVNAAAGPLEAIAEVCEGMLQVKEMLREATPARPSSCAASIFDVSSAVSSKPELCLPIPELCEDEGDADELKASEEAISLHMSRESITPPPRCATSVVAGKRSPSASRAGSSKSCTPRELFS